MIHHLLEVIEMIAILGVISSICYYVLCMWGAATFLRERRNARATQPKPPVSILKPLKDTDPEMYENFRSHCLQDYPEYEIIFGVSEANDPTVALVERLKKEFPERAIRMIVCPKNLGTNTKVSNLAQMVLGARYDYLVVNDSDIRVEPDYLQRVVSPLAESGVGLITCLYRAVASPTLGSRLEALGISTDFCPGVLAARQLEGGIRFGLGSTLAFRRGTLEAIGGFETFVDYLADDYEIGKRIAAQGFEVRLSEAVVETFLPLYTLRFFLDHQLRWARTIRHARRWGYVGLLLTFGLPWALVALILAHGAAWAWGFLAAVLCARLAMAVLVRGRVLQDRQVIRWLWLLPLRDMVAVFVWLGGLAGYTVDWRGDRFQLKNGRLVRTGS